MRRLDLLFALVAATSAVGGCAEDGPPRIVSTSLVLPTVDAYGPYEVVARVADESSGVRAIVRYVATTTSAAVSPDSPFVDMSESDDGAFVGTLPPFQLGTVVSYVVEATDRRDQLSVAPTYEAPHVFTVGNVPSMPQLIAVWPNEGPSTGQTEVLLVGRDFREGLTADFGPNRAQTVEVLSRTQARVLSPAGAPGLVDVTVINADGGRVTLVDAFTYFPTPEIFDVIPASGPVAGGTFVEIIGSRFQPGSTFTFDGVEVTQLTLVNESLATARTPPHPAGFVTVRVEHPTRGFGEKPNAFEYIPPPEVLAIDPERGPDLGGTFVTVTGRFFRPGARVSFDGIEAFNVAVVSSTELVGVTPAHTIGFSDVIVTNDDLQEGRLPRGFFFFGPPQIDRVVPPYSAVEGGATLRVLGQNFEPGTVVTAVTPDGVMHTLVCTLESANELSCLSPASSVSGEATVTVTNSDGRSDRLDGAFELFRILSVLPNRGPSPGGTDVIVIGERFPPNTEIYFGATRAVCGVANPTRIACRTPPGPLNAFVDVSALPTDRDQVPSVLIDGYFYVAPPEILSVNPPDGPLRGGTRITITGRFFQPGAAVTIRGLACQAIVVASDTSIQCTVPPGPSGFAEVTVINPDDQRDSDPRGFEYIPIVAEPLWSMIDGNGNITLTGRGFAPGAVVTFGGTPMLDVNVVSDREITLRTPGFATTGAKQIVVDNPADPPEVGPDLFSIRSFQAVPNTQMAGTGETSDLIVADLDNDGDNDFVYINGAVGLPARSQLVENMGNGTTFSVQSVGFNNVSNEGNACDVNNDNRIDFTFGVSGGDVRLYINNGGMNFTPTILPTTPSDSFEASLHDINGDGRCDFLNLAISSANTLLLNNGSGSFTVVNNAIPHEGGFVHDHKFDVGDLDRDGDIDIVVVVDDVNFGMPPVQRHRIYLNNGNNTFVEDPVNRPLLATIHGDIYDVRVEDIDGDGDLDIVTPNFGREPVVLINDGVGRFTRVTNRIPNLPRPDSAMFMEDIEGDGDFDVYMVSFDGAVDHALFLNDGRGFFVRATRGEPHGTGAAYRAAMGDINGDGTNDIIQGTANGANRMWFSLE